MLKSGIGIYCYIKNSKGFTLVELMLTIAISIVIVGALSVAYTTQQRTYIAQEQVAEMQQNLRAAIYLLATEIRMAGFDPTNTAGAGFTIAGVGQIGFTQDTNSDGDTVDAGEMIEFGLTATAVNNDNDRNGIPNDVDGDGVPDTLPLGRQVGGAGGYQAIADNIQAIEFLYFDSTGAPTAILADIRSVQISVLARAATPDRNFFNNDTYTPASGVANNWGPYGDNYRRRLLITNIKCRNMGI
jgi:type IV pilus assembly protein PilW